MGCGYSHRSNRELEDSLPRFSHYKVQDSLRNILVFLPAKTLWRSYNRMENQPDKRMVYFVYHMLAIQNSSLIKSLLYTREFAGIGENV